MTAARERGSCLISRQRRVCVRPQSAEGFGHSEYQEANKNEGASSEYNGYPYVSLHEYGAKRGADDAGSEFECLKNGVEVNATRMNLVRCFLALLDDWRQTADPAK